MQLNRRQVMQVGVAALAAGALPGCKVVERGVAEKPSGEIDAHSHVWSDDLKRYPLAPWATVGDMQPATFTPEQLFAVMKPSGFERAVLIQHAPLHGYDNSYILDCARTYPGSFSVVAMINERTPDLKPRLRDLQSQGARGIRIIPTKHADRTLNVDPPNWLKAPGMQLLWQHAAELGVAVCPLLEADFLPTLDPMCEQYPDTVCVIDHFGHVDMNKPQTVDSLTRLARHPNVYVKVSAFYKFADQKPPYDDLAPMVQRLVEAFGPNRLMWASDCPYQLNNGNDFAQAVDLIRWGMPNLSLADRRAILRGTAERVFFTA